MRSGYGGGLCQMANMIHYLVLNSPLEVTELHHHSDALFLMKEEEYHLEQALQ